MEYTIQPPLVEKQIAPPQTDAIGWANVALQNTKKCDSLLQSHSVYSFQENWLKV